MLKKIKGLIAERVLATVEKEVTRRVNEMKIEVKRPEPPAPVVPQLVDPAELMKMCSKATVSNPAYVCARFWHAMTAAGLLERRHQPSLNVERTVAINVYHVHIVVPPESGDMRDGVVDYHENFAFQGTPDVDVMANLAVAHVQRQLPGTRVH